ncbi:helix-turn-helix domain-containing protein [Actinoallomurus sp. NPDC052274]|uniref:TetR/AcrR family transcriptional regulator n=1 Tax=Actinoallomurus sp. NPDC052274 TaxID=3155420 RepID=UPI00344AA4FB
MSRSPTGLRDRLLASALKLFVRHGFRGTSLADIAADVDCSKASLLYHFSNKEAILAELLLPVGKELVALDGRLATLAGETIPEAAVSGVADLAVRFRQEFKLLFDNMSDAAALPELRVKGVDGIGRRLVVAMAGGSSEPQDEVAALMALGGMFVTGAADLPLDDETLRAALIGTALRTIGRARG